MTFTNDLSFATIYENRVLDIIEHTEYGRSEVGSKEYDIWTKYKDDDKVLFEVKADRKTMVTGNIAIEFQCRGKPSGITTSKSDYWIYFVHGTKKYYMIPTDILRQEIDNNTYIRKVKGGDDNVSEMYLFPESKFKQFLDYY